MAEKPLELLQSKQFRELERYIDETNFDISTPVNFVYNNKTFYKNCPFYTVACDLGDFGLVEYIMEKNVTPRIFRRYNRFLEACGDGQLGVIEFLLKYCEVTDEEKTHALWYMNLDFTEVQNKAEIIDCLIKYGAKSH